MKFYEIAMFLFIFNLTAFFVVQLEMSAVFDYETGGWDISDINASTKKMEAVTEEQTGWWRDLNWLVENVRLSIQAISSFMVMFVNAVGLSKETYTQLLCGWGASCFAGDPLALLRDILYYMTIFVYTAALLQFLSNKDMRTGV